MCSLMLAETVYTLQSRPSVRSTHSKLLNMYLPLQVVTDSKLIYTSLSIQRKIIDKSIRADENIIQFRFETYSVNKMIWIVGKTNIADVGTKRNSPLTDDQLMIFTI